VHPYRAPATIDAHAEAESWPDGDIVPVLVVFWILSAVRVAVGFARHDHASAEQTLALVCLVLGPLLLKEAALRWLRPSSKK
jgi:hypothetical protein